jgi:hypothetical protein
MKKHDERTDKADELKDQRLNLLNELSSGEDEFDVDLMACGCRLAVGGSHQQITLPQWVERTGLTKTQLQSILGTVIKEAATDKAQLTKLLDEVTLKTKYDMGRLQKVAAQAKKK